MSPFEIKLNLSDSKATQDLGNTVASLVREKGAIALVGNLGTGKTTFVQGLGQGLGIVEIINSPTFTMLNEYHSGRLPLYHLDLYRFADDAEEIFGSAGLENFLHELEEIQQGKGIVVMEWSNYLEEYVPADHLLVKLDYADEGASRTATLVARGEGSVEILNKLKTKVISS